MTANSKNLKLYIGIKYIVLATLLLSSNVDCLHEVFQILKVLMPQLVPVDEVVCLQSVFVTPDAF